MPNGMLRKKKALFSLESTSEKIPAITYGSKLQAPYTIETSRDSEDP
jgi:hypothetical protein